MTSSNFSDCINFDHILIFVCIFSILQNIKLLFNQICLSICVCQRGRKYCNFRKFDVNLHCREKTVLPDTVSNFSYI